MTIPRFCHACNGSGKACDELKCMACDGTGVRPYTATCRVCGKRTGRLWLYGEPASAMHPACNWTRTHTIRRKAGGLEVTG